MSSMPWVKLYTEILDDPKMADLEPSEKWLFIELILLAGECDQEGLIPLTLSRIAWRLRIDIKELQAESESLENAGLIEKGETGILVIAFSKRQERPQSVKRQQWTDAQRRHRNKTQVVMHDNDMTNTLVLRVEEEESRGEEESEHDKPPATALPTEMDLERIFTQVTGLMTIPATSRADDYERLHAIYNNKRGDSVEYLRPFWKAWTDRGYNKSNTAWLDWAITSEIPKQRSPNGAVNKVWTETE